MRQTTSPDSDPQAATASTRERTTLEIVRRVAAAKGCRPTDLDPLSTVTDPDALERLLRSASDAAFEVRFDYEDGRVVVAADGTVEFAVAGE